MNLILTLVDYYCMCLLYTFALEVKSAVISKMHNNLEDWEKRLHDIVIKKKENGLLHLDQTMYGNCI